MPVNARTGIILVRIIYRVVWIFVLYVSTENSLYAQEPGRTDVNDSLAIKAPINQSLLHSFQSDVILPSSLRETPIYSPGFVHQSLTNLPSSLSLQFQQQIDVVSPWKQELMKQNEYRTLRTVLGALQVGGTAYLLYEHIRKYGLK
jgi:hypothetical protein